MNTSLTSPYSSCVILHLLFYQFLVWQSEENSLFCYYCFQWPLDNLPYFNLEYCVYIALLYIACFLHTVCALPFVSILLWIMFLCCMSIVLQLIFKTSRVSMSGMSNRTWPFPGATKNSQLFCLLLWSVFTFHMPNCVIIVFSYVLGHFYFNFFFCHQQFFCYPRK